MTRSTSAIARAAAATLLVALAWIDGAGLESHARAMACCAHRHDCAGTLRAPDRCCERMGHTIDARTAVAVHVAGTPALAFVGRVAAAIPRAVVVPVSFPRTARLHDPPYLHTFAPLI